jgi:hypothetical protein
LEGKNIKELLLLQFAFCTELQHSHQQETFKTKTSGTAKPRAQPKILSIQKCSNLKLRFILQGLHL